MLGPRDERDILAILLLRAVRETHIETQKREQRTVGGRRKERDGFWPGVDRVRGPYRGSGI